MTDAAAHPERLRRALGLGASLAIVVGTVIGSGIFRVPAAVAAFVTSPGPYFLVWLIGGAVTLCGALTLAELGAQYPRAGGLFTYLAEVYGPLPAFLFGWSQLAVIRATALGGIAAIFAEYLAYFVPLTSAQQRVAAAVAIVIVAVINHLGVRLAAQVVSVAMVAKCVGIVGLVALAFGAGSGSWDHFHTEQPAVWTLSLMASAMVPIMWAYDGWADLASLGGELRRPERTLPIALAVGTTIVFALYLLLNAAYLYLLPLDVMAKSPRIAATAGERISVLGASAGNVVAALVMVSCFGTLSGSTLTNTRIFFAMAERGLLWRAVARVSPRFQTPSVAIWLAAALGVGYVLLNDFQQLANRFILGIWPFYTLGILGVFVVRRKRSVPRGSYRTPGYPVVPIVFVLAATGMVTNALVTDPVDTGITLLIIAVGIPIYRVVRR